ncbi:1-(5-phosphoribosyl)-5-[(5-phosphoribosylamino)methylideneamino]imidazole-4-carboxamide isomerase [Thermosulfurimonas sp. F29]|uniref:1-(5-phosphoribosyl)-5-[(5- phosphoribosylamino)methylideneamino]imidazole-4- carboxamide isomerase n=1 Tax=Thermosulfurimonas sp. F29 TaxID=2867247 RepID=UPI001C83D85C|nr:1-(5-phosphoribosyl)-5-[(5-phosphoribosylamino)methylideneamino]imidazole-4-carboxamide isomerase [Thermosulfurimonas sp. F29]MBX6422349.1 1-(5-phosphoribosyl)-5-[(5-phosphoribosylamino)methylideneamino]imidazole-4-carboxamide isomerase [Thermosulfurimonas sp. F29]
MLLIPAIDLKDGRCVRLYQGDYTRETVYAEDPVSQIRVFAAQGAKKIHIVDLSGAREGHPVHFEIIVRMAKAVSVPVEVGGGIRDLATIEHYLDSGVAQVILGTVACRNPELVKEAARLFPGRILVSLDVRGERVAVSGWTEAEDIHYLEMARRLEDAGVAGLIFTEIERDGTGRGVYTERLERLLETVKLPVVLAGGVSTLEDIRRLRGLEPRGLHGVIVGRAIYEGTINLAEALREVVA